MRNVSAQGLEAVLLANRPAVVRFLAARGAGVEAEDLVQELWLKLVAVPEGPISNPLSYIFRAAENLMRDRHRSERQANLREENWAHATGPAQGDVSDEPIGERPIIARQELQLVRALLDSFPARAQEAFRLHRMEEISQREIAARLGISLSTVEKDIRDVYRALTEAREKAK